ncbi:hypothetical protein JHK87_028167 [Glycine soja]|nr:hypothetical protein JHK87_028167 [Glycine soja]
MKSIGKDYDKIMEHASNRKLIPPSSPDKSNIAGAPKSNPRIGFEYEVEVPSMIKESKRLTLLMNPADSELVHKEVEDNKVRLSLEEYVSSLKSSVGLGVLVEAVGIGKGKEDLKLAVEETKVGGCNEEEAEKGSYKVHDKLEEIYPDDEQVNDAVIEILEKRSGRPSQLAMNLEANLNQPTTNEELKQALSKFRSLAYEESFKTCFDRPNYKKELAEAIDELIKFKDTMIEEDKHDLDAFIEIFDQAYPLSK